VANIIIHEGPTTFEFLGSLAVAGILAPILAVWQSRSADKRRFEHERRLHASDDLIERIEDVLTGLEGLGKRCAEMRQIYLSLGATEPDKLWPLVRAAEDAYQQSRVSIARLGMRPHANAEIVEMAEAGDKKFFGAVRAVGTHLIREAGFTATGREPSLDLPIEPVIDNSEEGYRLTREYATQARVAIGRLHGPSD
jgi:hypothetical protein